jgi:hypothetical protein
MWLLQGWQSRLMFWGVGLIHGKGFVSSVRIARIRKGTKYGVPYL